jgi:hypothetical protein
MITTKMHKTKYRKTKRQGQMETNLTAERENRNFRKTFFTTVQKHYADLEDTCREKVTKFGVIVRYTKKVIEKNKGWGKI